MDKIFFAPMVCLSFGHVYVKDVVNLLCNGRVLLGSISEFFNKVNTFLYNLYYTYPT